MLLLILILLPSCTVTGGAGDFCAVYRPVYVDELDRFTNETARTILTNNEVWRARCSR